MTQGSELRGQLTGRGPTARPHPCIRPQAQGSGRSKGHSDPEPPCTAPAPADDGAPVQQLVQPHGTEHSILRRRGGGSHFHFAFRMRKQVEQIVFYGLRLNGQFVSIPISSEPHVNELKATIQLRNISLFVF